MDTAAHRVSAARTASLTRPDLSTIGAWLLAFVPVVYLGLRGGGYDSVVRGEAGIAIWWVLALGALAGVLPVARPSRAAWAAIAAFGLFTAWTAAGIAWSDSAERSTLELARVVTYLGVLVLALCSLDGRTARSAFHGAGVGMAFVCALAVLSRLRPTWFPQDDVAAFLLLQETSTRLNYPLNYADGVGSFAAIAAPVLLAVAATARTIAGKALAAGALPVVLLALYLSGSRGGLLAVAAGLAVWIALAPDRLPRLATLSISGVGAAILIAATADRTEFRDGLQTATAAQQADEMVAYLVVVCLGVALLQGALATALRYGERPAWSRPSRRGGLIATAAVLAVGLVGAVAVGAPSELNDKWGEFKSAEASTVAGTDVFSRLQDISGSNRYQYWQSALRATETDTLKGIGPGTFEFWWAQDGAINEFIRDAHSLYVETLAELGVVGLALLLVALGLMFALGSSAALRAGPNGPRAVAAGATAGFAAFAAGATVNWSWELGVLPVAALLLVAIALAARREPAATGTVPRLPLRAGVVVAAVVAVVVIAIPLATTQAVRESQASVRSGELGTALGRADGASELQPYAASPRLQRALVLERAGAYKAASVAAAQATDRAPDDWRLWLVRSRIEARAGDAAASVAAYRRAKALNPRSGFVNPPR